MLAKIILNCKMFNLNRKEGINLKIKIDNIFYLFLIKFLLNIIFYSLSCNKSLKLNFKE